MTTATPINAKSEMPYMGENAKTLKAVMASQGFTDPRFVTFNQAKEMGYWVKKGSKAVARISGKHGKYAIFHVSQTTMPVAAPAPAPVEEHDFADFDAAWESDGTPEAPEMPVAAPEYDEDGEVAF